MPPASATLTLRSLAPDVTRSVAAAIARHLAPGDLVALTGELGAGKTCFVQGAARELGVIERVRSPSFMLRRDYEGRLGVTHLDVYRLDTFGEVLDLGHDEPGQRERVTFVEWGDAIRPLLPPDHLEVEFRLPPPDAAVPLDIGDEAEPRTLVLRAHGSRWLQRIESVTVDCREWMVP